MATKPQPKPWWPAQGPRIDLYRMPAGYPTPNDSVWRDFRWRYRQRALAVAERTGRPCEVYDRNNQLIDIVDPP